MPAAAESFSRIAENHRREIQLHCYRMLGSYQEAEDLAQETFLRAWRGFDRFEGRGSLRGWLYQIATNACLNTLARRPGGGRRTLPEMQGPPSERPPEGGPSAEAVWLDPYPDSALEGIPDTAPGPYARYEIRESVRLAFVAAIQLLPPRQRAVILLTDVLGWSASETAEILDTPSVASVNSALQRARATLKKRLPTNTRSWSPSQTSREDNILLDRYVRAWESSDLEGFIGLIRSDATMNMPPWREWYCGRAAIHTFFASVWYLPSYAGFRLIPIGMNGQPGFALYSGSPVTGEFRAHSLHALTIREETVVALTAFIGPHFFVNFGLPNTLPAASETFL